ncbi:MAG: HEAT repeat domain-containing protein, partial [Chthoniobacteraceae bacterium]
LQTAPAPAPVAHVAQPAPAPLKAIVVPTDGAIELQTAVDQRLVKADLISNGREHLSAEISNLGTQPLTIKISFGQMFESGRNTVVATRSAQAEIAPGKSATLAVQTAATRSTNRVVAGPYRLSARTAPKIDLLLTYTQEHPDLSPAVLQTAVLALMENLPLSSLCKFVPAGADLPSRFDTTAFRVETPELLAALNILREIGVRDRELAMTIDPQLRIEAMIDPSCRATAMHYYGITTGAEWNYWKNELLEGDPGTRHYALYGIARFYPEVALEMLPQWAREKRTTPIFRLTAVQALAETQRPEALPLLEKLSAELGRNTELGRAAAEAAQALNLRLERIAGGMPTVAFRSSSSALPF